MTACAIRYRLDGSGPATFLVDCGGQLRIFTRGTLGGIVPRGQLLALLAESGCRWVSGHGTLEIDLTEASRTAPDARESLIWLPPGNPASHHTDLA